MVLLLVEAHQGRLVLVQVVLGVEIVVLGSRYSLKLRVKLTICLRSLDPRQLMRVLLVLVQAMLSGLLLASPEHPLLLLKLLLFDDYVVDGRVEACFIFSVFVVIVHVQVFLIVVVPRASVAMSRLDTMLLRLTSDEGILTVVLVLGRVDLRLVREAAGMVRSALMMIAM